MSKSETTACPICGVPGGWHDSKCGPVVASDSDLSQYRPETLPEHLRWKGDGPPPARWTAPDGTVVYRSYADYCDD